jgi:hypothetical protein
MKGNENGFRRSHTPRTVRQVLPSHPVAGFQDRRPATQSERSRRLFEQAEARRSKRRARRRGKQGT